MTIFKTIGKFGRKLKSATQNFIKEYWIFHPILSFLVYASGMIGAFQDQTLTKLDSIILYCAFFAFNAFFYVMWEYKKHLIAKDEQ